MSEPKSRPLLVKVAEDVDEGERGHKPTALSILLALEYEDLPRAFRDIITEAEYNDAVTQLFNAWPKLKQGDVRV